jgi:DnaJ-class molecular chaperone
MKEEKQLSSEIIICPLCKGYGKIETRNSLYETKDQLCSKCDGKRVVRKIIIEIIEKIN